MNFIYKGIDALQTPVGCFTVSNGNERIRFSVARNCYDMPYGVYDHASQTVIGKIHTDTNYHILIDTSKLNIGTTYTVAFSSGIWGYCDSDEHTACYSTIIGNWAVGIGAYDPNDEEKLDQALKYSEKTGLLKKNRIIEYPDQFDESLFTSHTIEFSPDLRGFEFKILDKSLAEISFEVAWIQIKDDYASDFYISALGFWLC